MGEGPNSEKERPKSVDVPAMKRLPRPAEYQDDEISFNFSRTEDNKEKKKPLYMKSFSPEKLGYDDLDWMPIGPDDFKKKKKPRKPRKPAAKKTLMTLAFDSNETKIASVVKK